MKKLKLSPKQMNRLIKMYEEGVSTKEISDKFEISVVLVNNYAKMHGISRPKDWVKTTANFGKKTTKTPKIEDQLRFVPYGNVGLQKSFELDCWHILRLNEVAGVSSELKATAPPFHRGGEKPKKENKNP